MVKRYYCDYCDRSYPYSVEARKKHINGYQHQKVRTLHYNKFKTAVERLQEETKKEKCRRFHSGQECSFGDACIYSHFTISDWERLRQEAHLEKNAKQRNTQHLRPENEELSVANWISKRFKESQDITKFSVLDETDGEANFRYPKTAVEQASLPPSLIPPTPDTLLDSEFQDWG